MKNIDKYRELIERERQKGSVLIGVVNGIPVNCREIDSCDHCYKGDRYKGNVCSVEFVNWLFEEAEPAEEPEPQKAIPTREDVIKAIADVSKENEKLPPELALPLMAKLLSDYMKAKKLTRFLVMTWLEAALRGEEEMTVAQKVMDKICGKKPMNS